MDGIREDVDSKGHSYSAAKPCEMKTRPETEARQKVRIRSGAARPQALRQLAARPLRRNHRTLRQHALVDRVVAAVLRVNGTDLGIVRSDEH